MYKNKTLKSTATSAIAADGGELRGGHKVHIPLAKDLLTELKIGFMLNNLSTDFPIYIV